MGGGVSKKKYEELEYANKQLKAKMDGLKDDFQKKEEEVNAKQKKNLEELSELKSKLNGEHNTRIKIEDDLLKEKNFKLKLGEEVLTAQNENEQIKSDLEIVKQQLIDKDKKTEELARIEKEKYSEIIKQIKNDSIDKNRIAYEKTEAAQLKLREEHEKLLSTKALLHEENSAKVKLEHEVEFIQRERESVQNQLLTITQHGGGYYQDQHDGGHDDFYAEHSQIEQTYDPNNQQIQLYHGGGGGEQDDGGGGDYDIVEYDQNHQNNHQNEELLMEKDAQIYELENEKQYYENEAQKKIEQLENDAYETSLLLKQEKDDIYLKHEKIKTKHSKQISDLMDSHSKALQQLELKNIRELNNLRDQVQQTSSSTARGGDSIISSINNDGVGGGGGGGGGQSSMTARQSELISKHELTIEVMEKQHTKKINELNDTLIKEIETEKLKSSEKEKSIMETLKKQHDEEILSIKKNYNNEINELKELKNDIIKSGEETNRSNNEKNDRLIHNLQKEHELKIKELNEQIHLESKLSYEKAIEKEEKNIEKLKIKHDDQLNAIISKHRDEIDNYNHKIIIKEKELLLKFEEETKQNNLKNDLKEEQLSKTFKEELIIQKEKEKEKLLSDFEKKQSEGKKELINKHTLELKEIENQKTKDLENLTKLYENDKQAAIQLLESTSENKINNVTKEYNENINKEKIKYEELNKKYNNEIKKSSKLNSKNKYIKSGDSKYYYDEEKIALGYINSLKVNLQTTPNSLASTAASVTSTNSASPSSTSITPNNSFSSFNEAPMKSQIKINDHYLSSYLNKKDEDDDDEDEEDDDENEYSKKKQEAKDLMNDISNKKKKKNSNSVMKDSNKEVSKNNLMNFSGSATDMMSLMASAGIVLPATQQAALNVATAQGSKPEACGDPHCGHDHSHGHEHGHHHHHHHDEEEDIAEPKNNNGSRSKEKPSQKKSSSHRQNNQYISQSKQILDEFTDQDIGIEQDDEEGGMNEIEKFVAASKQDRYHGGDATASSYKRGSSSPRRPSSAHAHKQQNQSVVQQRPLSASSSSSSSHHKNHISSPTLFEQQQMKEGNQSDNQSVRPNSDRNGRRGRSRSRSRARPNSAPMNRGSGRVGSSGDSELKNNEEKKTDDFLASRTVILDKDRDNFASTSPASTFNFASLTSDYGRDESMGRSSSENRPFSSNSASNPRPTSYFIPKKIWPQRSSHGPKLHPNGPSRKRQYRLLIDSSSSMRTTDDKRHAETESRWDLTREACQKVIPQLASKKDNLGLQLYFFNSVFTKFSNIRTEHEVADCFDSIYPKGSTSLSEALADALGLTDMKLTLGDGNEENSGGFSSSSSSSNGQGEIKDDNDSSSLSSLSCYPLTVLILTDGTPDNRLSVEEVIRTANDNIKYDDDLSILIIQIGFDHAASKWLQALEDRLQCKEGVIKTTTLEDYSTSKTAFPMYVLDIVMMSQQKKKWRAFKKNSLANLASMSSQQTDS